MVYVTATPTSAQNGGMRPKPNLVTDIQTCIDFVNCSSGEEPASECIWYQAENLTDQNWQLRVPLAHRKKGKKREWKKSLTDGQKTNKTITVR